MIVVLTEYMLLAPKCPLVVEPPNLFGVLIGEGSLFKKKRIRNS